MTRLSLKRRRDWEKRLSRLISARHAAPFQWGENDCLMLAADCVKAVTGVDPGAAHRGRYASKLAAARYLKGLGASDAAAYLDRLFEPVPPAFARRGDLVMHDGSAGICIGGVALFVGNEGEADGLVRVPFGQWSHAWKVG